MQVTSNLPALTTLPAVVQSRQLRLGEEAKAKANALSSQNDNSKQTAGLSELKTFQLKSTKTVADNFLNSQRSTRANQNQQAGESVAYDSTDNAFKLLSNVTTEKPSKSGRLASQSPTSLYQTVQTVQLREDLSSAIGINLFA